MRQNKRIERFSIEPEQKTALVRAVNRMAQDELPFWRRKAVHEMTQAEWESLPSGLTRGVWGGGNCRDGSDCLLLIVEIEQTKNNGADDAGI